MIWGPFWRRRKRFQSTPSPRRATSISDLGQWYSINFNPRPPRGGRRQAQKGARWQAQYFNPRPPRGGRHIRVSLYQHNTIISIHALPAEGDQTGDADIPYLPLFQSTPSPRRATLKRSLRQQILLPFQSTPSPRRATNSGRLYEM